MNKTLRDIHFVFSMSLSFYEASFASFPICFLVNNYSDIFSRKRRSFSNSVASGFSGLKTMIFSLNCFRNFLSLIELKLHLHHFRYFSGSTNHVSFILFTFFLKRVSSFSKFFKFSG